MNRTKIDNGINEPEKYERVKHLVYQDIILDIMKFGVRQYIESGIRMNYYLSINDGINALYSKSMFYTWLIDCELYEEAGFIKKEVAKIKYEESEK